jgi:hypothetical protein
MAIEFASHRARLCHVDARAARADSSATRLDGGALLYLHVELFHQSALIRRWPIYAAAARNEAMQGLDVTLIAFSGDAQAAQALPAASTGRGMAVRFGAG